MKILQLCKKTVCTKIVFGTSLGILSFILVTHEAKQFYFNKQQLSEANSIAEIGKRKAERKAYTRTLSPLQIEDLIRKRIGVDNLTTEISRQQFLSCSGTSLLQNNPARIPPSHQHCKKMSFKSSGPVVALGSFPGSGNSWVRQLLESATGVYTGAVYCDKSYIEKGMIGEGVTTENVITVKTHASPNKAKQVINHDKAIYVVRNPFGSILANYNRLLGKKYADVSSSAGGSHTFIADPKFAYKKDWNSKVKYFSRKWKSRVTLWLDVTEYPVLFIGYENLVKDTFTELKRMLDFIGYPYSEDDITCAVKSSNTFHRNHTNHTKEHSNVYTPEQQEFVNNIIRDVDAGLLKHNISIYNHYADS